MSRRTLISSMIAEQLAAANSGPKNGDQNERAQDKSGTAAPSDMLPARVAAGPVRTMGLTLDKLELERKSLEDALAEGGSIVELDTALIEGSFAADRFADHGDGALDALRQSIADHGQEVPILVRPLTDRPGYYQVAYGHRRLRACQMLDRPVRAMVRPLSDTQLVIAQGLENASRVDLSFIEKARFASGLEERGFDRATIMAALSTDKTELSKLLATAHAVPEALVRAIGPAPRAGRRRWVQLADLIKDKQALRRVDRRVAEPRFSALDTDGRFLAVLDAALRSDADKAIRAPLRMTIKGPDGTVLVSVQETDRKTSLTINRLKDPAFANYLIREMPEIYAQFLTDEGTPVNGSRRYNPR